MTLGRNVHSEYKLRLDNGQNLRKEYRLPSGKRIDFIDLDNKIVYELKPNNPSAIKSGQKQAQEYVNELIEEFGGEWTIIIDTY